MEAKRGTTGGGISVAGGRQEGESEVLTWGVLENAEERMLVEDYTLSLQPEGNPDAPCRQPFNLPPLQPLLLSFSR